MLHTFPRHLARENTQLSPSLTPTLGTVESAWYVGLRSKTKLRNFRVNL